MFDYVEVELDLINDILYFYVNNNYFTISKDDEARIKTVIMEIIGDQDA